MQIDAHQHFWHYDPVEFDWIDDTMRAIRKDFLPGKLEAAMTAAGIDGCVSVQARQSTEETDWLLELAERNAFIRAVVGWLPLAAEDIQAQLEKYSHDPKLKGLRHVVQGEADGFLDGEAFNQGIRALKAYDLTYDILIVERQLLEAIRFVDRHPEQTFVLDHIAKPRIRENLLSPWRKNITELALRENVFCKISGLVTEADHKQWTAEQLYPFLDTALENFGPQRLMFGSDWPVCLVATKYSAWAELVRAYTSHLSAEEQADIFGGTACRAYRIEQL